MHKNKSESSFVGSFVGTMKDVPEEGEEEEDEEWSSLTTAPPKLPGTLVRLAEEEEWILPEPPDGGWGWMIVLASFFCNVVVDGIAYSFGIFLIHFVRYYNESKGKTAWVGSLLTGCYLAAGPIVSGLTNKFGCRPVTIAGSIISCIAFLLSTVAPNVDFLMLTYGIMAGIGFGLIYLPAIVSVGYYFSTKRAFATGIAVCGSGMGAFLFAPLTQFLLETYDWKGALLILAGLSLNCAVFGALMRPLEPIPAKKMQDGPIGPLAKTNHADSTSVLQNDEESRVPLINTEPGVQSTLNLDQVPRMSMNSSLKVDEGLRNSIDVVPGLTITEGTPNASTKEIDGSSLTTLTENKPMPKQLLKVSQTQKELQRRFTMPAAMPASTTNVLLPNNNLPVDGNPRGESFAVPIRRQQQRRPSSKKDLARPLYRKDIFYSGSIVNLPQYRESKADIRCYLSSVTTIPQHSDDEEEEKTKIKPKRKRRCPKLPKSMRNTLKEALDISLLKNPPFLLTCIANILGMMGFYIPFVYVTDSSIEKNIDYHLATFLLSIIGITNLIGRLLFGFIVDRTGIKALDVNNVCLGVAGVAIFFLPFCMTYGSIVASCTIFSVFVSSYISLTSIILVDMVGLDKLTNSFGLLTFFRGASSIIGPPLAGTVYDATGNYDIPFYLAGALLVLSGICTCVVRVMLTRSQPKCDIRLSVTNEDGAVSVSDPTTVL